MRWWRQSRARRRWMPVRGSPRTRARPSSGWPTAFPRAPRQRARSRCRRSSSSWAWINSRWPWATSRQPLPKTWTARGRPKSPRINCMNSANVSKEWLVSTRFELRHRRQARSFHTTGPHHEAMEDDKFLKLLLKTFEVEAQEHLAAMSQMLLQLERDPLPAEAAVAVETLFREAHSLKGASRSVNLTDIERVCQPMGGALAPLKAGERAA